MPTLYAGGIGGTSCLPISLPSHSNFYHSSTPQPSTGVITMKQPNNNSPKVTVLKEGAVSPYTACKECGKQFKQRNTTTRFRALARHYYNGCQD